MIVSGGMEEIFVKKNVILKALSIFLILVSLFAMLGAITVTGSGFLDLSNIVRAACIFTVVVCLILAVFAWKFSEPKA